MKYKRLTNGNFDGQCDHWTSLAFMGGEIGCWNEAEERYMLCEECIHKQRYDRLRDLEDKIEAGTLVELPCKVGDTVYIVYSTFIQKWEVSSIQIYEDKILFRLGHKGTNDYNSFWLGEIGKYVFLTKAEAEARLKELRGEV